MRHDICHLFFYKHFHKTREHPSRVPLQINSREQAEMSIPFEFMKRHVQLAGTKEK